MNFGNHTYPIMPNHYPIALSLMRLVLPGSILFIGEIRPNNAVSMEQWSNEKQGDWQAIIQKIKVPRRIDRWMESTSKSGTINAIEHFEITHQPGESQSKGPWRTSPREIGHPGSIHQPSDSLNIALHIRLHSFQKQNSSTWVVCHTPAAAICHPADNVACLTF